MVEEYYEQWEYLFLFDQPLGIEENEEEIARDPLMTSPLAEGNLLTLPFIQGDCLPDIPWGLSAFYLY